MKTITIKTKKDIKIEKDFIIPRLYANDAPIGFEIFIPAGAVLERRRDCYITTTDSNDISTATPYASPIFTFISNKAIEDGAEQIITEDNKKVFTMYKLITENRIVPEEGNYITDFEAETIEEAKILAGKYAEKCNFNFQYTVR